MRTATAIAALAALACAAPAAAQERTPIGNARYVAVGAPNHKTADDIVGRPVQSADGRTVGRVSEILIDDARIAALVVDRGDARVAVNYAGVSTGVSGNGGPAMVLDRRFGTLADAPPFYEFRDAPAAATMQLVR